MISKNIIRDFKNSDKNKQKYKLEQSLKMK